MSNIKKNITIFDLKIIIFIAVKNCSILHRHACVMGMETGILVYRLILKSN